MTNSARRDSAACPWYGHARILCRVRGDKDPRSMLLAIVEWIDVVEEEDMPTSPTPTWRLRRRPAPRPDKQQRWDRASVRLLQWTQAPQQPAESAPGQEDNHDGRVVCARLDPAPGPHAND
jgi:hypothetical protein